MHSREATCPHALKRIADWLRGLAVACTCFICEFLSSKAVDAMAKLHDDNCEKVYATCWNNVPRRLKCIKKFLIKNYDLHLSHFPSGIYGSCSGILYADARGNFHRIPKAPEDFYPSRIIPERYPPMPHLHN